MESSPSRLPLRLVAAAYVLVFGVSALLVFARYMQYVRNPQDVAAAGGMYAGGDLMLEIFICFLFLLPTAALVWIIRKSESAYTVYAKLLFGLSLTAPISVGLVVVPFLREWYWGNVCLFRLFAIPIMLGVLIVSLLLTRFTRARRLILYALLVEGSTFIMIITAAVVLLSRNKAG